MMSRFQINPLRGVAIVLLTIAAPLSFFASCAREKKDLIEYQFDPETSYTIKETNVETYVSDSGFTRFKMIADTWMIFGKASESYWYFPDKVYVEMFDTAFNIEASVQADTAYYYERRKLWILNGHVDISNQKGERFQTSQLFWEDNPATEFPIYSDSAIRITKGESVNTGIGFRSNQNLSIYEIYNSSADIPINMQHQTTAGDSIPVDSTMQETALETPISSKPEATISPKNNLTDTQEKE